MRDPLRECVGPEVEHWETGVLFGQEAVPVYNRFSSCADVLWERFGAIILSSDYIEVLHQKNGQ